MIHTEMECCAKSNPVPSWHGMNHIVPRQNQGNKVPENVRVPADEPFAEKSHQKSRRLDSKQGVEPKIHHTTSWQGWRWQQMTSNSDELEECIAKKNRPGRGEVVGVLLTIKLAPDRSCIGFSIATSDLICNQMVDKNKCQYDSMIDPVVLERPHLRKYCN